MHTPLLLAGLVAIAVGLVHSVLGEVLIFQRLRRGTLVPTQGHPLLRERHVRILWASWHLPTVLGLAIGVILLRQADATLAHPVVSNFALQTLAIAMATCAALVGFATKGRHPGWVGLLAVAVLVWMG